MMQKTTWTIDAGHSEVQFKVKHLAIANVSGTFRAFAGTVQNEQDDFDGAEIRFGLETNSLDTNNAERDKHLRSDLFLDTERFPKISFDGRLHKSGDSYQLEGEFTILDHTQKIQMQADYAGMGTGRFGDVRAGFELNGKINRRDFGLTFHLLNEAGNLVVGEEIRLHADIELIRSA